MKKINVNVYGRVRGSDRAFVDVDAVDLLNAGSAVLQITVQGGRVCYPLDTIAYYEVEEYDDAGGAEGGSAEAGIQTAENP